MSLHASRTLLRILVLALGAPPINGQTANTGAIAGTVSDPIGALVRRAAVVISSQGTGEKRDLATDAQGNFSAEFLPPGIYDLTVGAAGFEPFVLKDVRVQITEVCKVKIPLALGARGQIAVSAAPPLLQTENATLGRVIDRNTLEELPLVNRNFTEILGLTAGTNTDIVDATQLGAGSQEIRANGARSGDNNFMLNGVDANSYSSNMTEVPPFGGSGIAIPAPDTIQEFKVQTSLYDAQYGRGAGANVNVETKSGTAAFHGNAYYFGRNEALDANNFFANATGVPRGEFRRSQPGGTLGGPTPWRLFLRFLSSHKGRECGFSEQQYQLSEPPSHRYARTRLIAHMEWALEERDGVSDLLEYEARFNLVHDPRDPVICAYDLTKFSGEIIMDVLRTHPTVIVGGILQKNPFFIPPEQFLQEIRARRANSDRSRSTAN